MVRSHTITSCGDRQPLEAAVVVPLATALEGAREMLSRECRQHGRRLFFVLVVHDESDSGRSRFHLSGASCRRSAERAALCSRSSEGRLGCPPTGSMLWPDTPPPGGISDVLVMLRTLLAERFARHTRTEKRRCRRMSCCRPHSDRKPGSRLRVSTIDCSTNPVSAVPNTTPADAQGVAVLRPCIGPNDGGQSANPR
jgi:hypothetical protein